MVLVGAANELIQRNPAVAVELDLSHRPVNLIDEGFDLAIRGRLTLEDTLVTRHLATSHIVICAAPEYLSWHGAPQEPYDLADHFCLHFPGLRWAASGRSAETVRICVSRSRPPSKSTARSVCERRR